MWSFAGDWVNAFIVQTAFYDCQSIIKTECLATHCMDEKKAPNGIRHSEKENLPHSFSVLGFLLLP